MKKKVLILPHGNKHFLDEVLSYLEGLDIEIITEEGCPVEDKISYDFTPDAVIVNTTLLHNDQCMQHIKEISLSTTVLVADRDATVGRYIHMQVLGAKDYFHVPLHKDHLRSAVIDLLKLSKT